MECDTCATSLTSLQVDFLLRFFEIPRVFTGLMTIVLPATYRFGFTWESLGGSVRLLLKLAIRALRRRLAGEVSSLGVSKSGS